MTFFVRMADLQIVLIIILIVVAYELWRINETLKGLADLLSGKKEKQDPDKGRLGYRWSRADERYCPKCGHIVTMPRRPGGVMQCRECGWADTAL